MVGEAAILPPRSAHCPHEVVILYRYTTKPFLITFYYASSTDFLCYKFLLLRETSQNFFCSYGHHLLYTLFFCILLVHSIPYQRIYLCLQVAAVGQKRVNKKPVLIVSQEMISIIFQRTSILKKNSQIISGGISTPPLKKVPLLCTYQHCDQEFFRRFTLYLVPPPCPSVPNE